MTPESKLRAAAARSRFAASAGQRGELDLAQAALLIAAEDDHVDVSHYLAVIDQLGRDAAALVAANPGAGIEVFNDFLFQQNGFHGNQTRYYDPHNSHLHKVLDDRIGIPITLAIVYLEVGRRAGLETEGVGMPGHFIVRVREAGALEALLVDPFDARVIDRTDCQARLDELFAGSVALNDEHLRGSNSREILARLLTNLKAIYTRARMYRQALSAVERILLLRPQDAAEQRDRGALLAQLDRLPEAIWSTQLYLQLYPRANDADEVKEQLYVMQRQLAAMN